jgi:hypothetical protein
MEPDLRDSVRLTCLQKAHSTLKFDAGARVYDIEERTARLPTPIASPSMPPSVLTSYPTVKTTDSVHVLLLDTLNTEALDQAFVRDQMMQYLANAQPGARLEYPGYYRTSEGKANSRRCMPQDGPKRKRGRIAAPLLIPTAWRQCFC